MNFKIKSTGNKHEVFLCGNNISGCTKSVNIDISAGEIPQVNINTVISASEIICENANVFINIGDKKYRIMEEK